MHRAVTRTTSRRVLCGVFLLTIPLPCFMGALGLLPSLRLYFLLGLFGAVWVTEGGETTGLFVLLVALQSLLYTGLLYLLARGVAALLETRVPGRLRGWVLGLIVLGLLGTSLFEIYHTPLSSHGPRSSLRHIFD